MGSSSGQVEHQSWKANFWKNDQRNVHVSWFLQFKNQNDETGFFWRGEVVRQVLVDLIQEGLMFVGHDSSELHKHGRFYTKYVSEIESDPVGDFTLCRQALANLGLDQVSDEDCSAVRYVCECVSRRAGFMVSAGITALLKKMDYKDVVVAIDGNLI